MVERPSLKSRRVSYVETRDEGSSRVGRGSSLKFSPAGEEIMRVAMKATNADSQQVLDPFQSWYVATGGEANAIQPPYSFAALQRLPDENSMLRQCIDAMTTNVEGHGYRLEYVGPDGSEDSPAAKAEKRKIENFLNHPNPDMSLSDVRDRWRRDRETLGNAALEVGRNEADEIVMINHVPFHTLRLTFREAEAVDVVVTIPADPSDPNSKDTTVTQKKHFRRFVQRVGANLVYFKEFGDPRTISPISGKEDDTLPPDQSATEIIHSSIYAPGTPYGVPRWINQMPSILGSRQAELTNLDFFRENAIPAMAVLVSGGKLTQTSVDEIEGHISAARGRKSMNRVMVLEALGSKEAGSEDGTIPPPKIELKPMAGERQKDGFFMVYGDNCDKKIRSSFRLPPIFVGQSEDYSHATAKASYEVAESQVFGPERRVTDDVINSKVLRSLKPKYWELRSNPPRISDTEDVIAALEAFESMGALTPNTAINMANEYFDLALPKIKEAWGDLPFELTKLIAQQEIDRLKGFDKFVNPAPEPVIGPDGKPVAGTVKPKPNKGTDTTTNNGPAAPGNDPKVKTSILEVLGDNVSALKFALTAAAVAHQAEEEEAHQHVHVEL